MLTRSGCYNGGFIGDISVSWTINPKTSYYVIRCTYRSSSRIDRIRNLCNHQEEQKRVVCCFPNSKLKYSRAVNGSGVFILR